MRSLYRKQKSTKRRPRSFRTTNFDGGDTPPDSGSTRHGSSSSNSNDAVVLRRCYPQKVASGTLLTWSQIEAWQQDNAHILTAYRPASYSVRKSFASVLYLHNEFVNIHTHLWGGVLFAAIPLYLYLKKPPAPETVERLPHPTPWSSADTAAFACFFAGAVS